MIIRIVKMTFEQERVPEFLDVFNASKELIRGRSGCSHLELLKDINTPNVFFTYSYWEAESYLEDYRNSDLFKEVWAKTKILFSAKAEAWSLQQQVIL